MDLGKNKIVLIEKGKTKEFLQFLKDGKEKNKGFKERCQEISNHIKK